MTINEYAAKRNLTPEQTEELNEQLDIIADAIADFIIKNGLLEDEKWNTLLYCNGRHQGNTAHKKTGTNDFDIVYPRWVEPIGVSSNCLNYILLLYDAVF
jgi:hypothetical protein